MTRQKISRADLGALLAKLQQDYTVYAPAEVAGYSTFRPITSPEEVDWYCLVTRKPPKELFFPQSETLFEYICSSDGLALHPGEGVQRERILWGVRPCDARAMLVQDTVFNTSEARDVYYSNKREHTTIVGIGCNEPLQTCFCTSVGGRPFRHEGFDLFLTDIGDAYLVEALTPKGDKLLEGSELFPVSQADLRTAQAVEQAARQRLPAPIDLEHIQKRLQEMINSPFWDEAQAPCLGCGICTFLCPVCHCFDIVDEPVNASCGLRVRNWDTCQYCIYTLEASGHNPRPGGRERVRQRLMHKFDYQPLRQNVLGCVGCGRCVQLCPVNIDIRQLLVGIGATE
ncbi:MAG: 4Fe-4S ferredoxin [Chloroflexi bacterium]|nr:4Fe-4S ferredoxin [Chloroflexota bacterium]